MDSLAARDYAFLDGVEPSRYDGILKLGESAPYYVGVHLSLAGKGAEARRMFAIGAEAKDEPWRLLCLEALTATGTASERLASCGELKGYLEGRLSKADRKDASRKRDGEDARPRAELERLSGALDAVKGLELELSLETGSREPGSDEIASIFYGRAMTKTLVALVPNLPAGLPAELYGIAAARVSAFRRDYGSAWAGAKAILSAGHEAAFSRPVLSDFCKSALYGSADPAAEALYLDALRAKRETGAAGKSGESPYVLAFYSGRLFMAAADRIETNTAAGRREEKRLRETARSRLEAAFSLAVADGDADVALWYMLKNAETSDPGAFLATASECAARWSDPDFFSDILDSFVVARVAARDMGSVERLYRALAGRGGGETLARIAYLAARSGSLAGEDRVNAYRAAFEGDHGSLYYRVLSAEALGIPVADPSSLYRARRAAFSVATDPEEARQVLSGFIDFKLPERVYPEAVARYPGLPLAVARDLAKRLESDGEWASGIRLMAAALREDDGPVSDADLEIVYPRPWLAEISAAAKEYGLPEYLLYAMIRSESLFSPGVRSQAGAVGLAQLMRPTAGDIARRLGLSSYDLDDPATNVKFGAFFLADMIKRMDGRVLPALFAYNAGITKVRRWQKDGSGLADDVFLEGLPYAETREYGRKVLAAAAVYGYLYYQKSPGQVVRELF
jgi:soluble lytic murein transglycosylase